MSMKIICAVKFVPDLDSVVPGVEVNRLSSRNILLNPDDVCALAFALRVKAGDPDCRIEVVTLGDRAVQPHIEDLLRLGVDRGTLISDPLPNGGNAGEYAGGDAFFTGEVLGRYIATRPFDCLLTGSCSLDGGTSQVPALLAEILGLDHMLGIARIDPHRFDATRAVFEVGDDNAVTTYEMAMPGVLSLTREISCKLPYIKLEDMRRDVSDRLTVLTGRDLGGTETGKPGSQTQVVRTYPKINEKRNGQILGTDEQGITAVFDFLKEKGFL